MSADRNISRRAFAGGLALLGLGARARAQGFAGLSEDAADYAQVKPGKAFSFPADHGPHPDFRIEWWYVTANLKDGSGTPFGAQWTLFRQALAPGAQQEGWANQQIWMAHAAVTRADTHRFSQTFARGGVGQAGVTAEPFARLDRFLGDARRRRLQRERHLAARAERIRRGFFLRAAARSRSSAGAAGRVAATAGNRCASRPPIITASHFSRRAAASSIDDKPVEVTGLAWMDREWSSQPLAPDQNGWDWFALHFASGEKLMLYRMRQTDGNDYVSGNWIVPDGTARQLAPADIRMTPGAPDRDRRPQASGRVADRDSRRCRWRSNATR